MTDPNQGPPKDAYEAIKDHLVVLLNTRRGAIAHLPEFGLPDLANIYKGYPDSLHYLGAEIKRTIERYEPRLTGVKVELMSSSSTHFEANFTVKAYLRHPDGKLAAVTFRTMVSQGGKTQIGE